MYNKVSLQMLFRGNSFILLLKKNLANCKPILQNTWMVIQVFIAFQPHSRGFVGGFHHRANRCRGSWKFGDVFYRTATGDEIDLFVQVPSRPKHLKDYKGAQDFLCRAWRQAWMLSELITALLANAAMRKKDKLICNLLGVSAYEEGASRHRNQAFTRTDARQGFLPRTRVSRAAQGLRRLFRQGAFPHFARNNSRAVAWNHFRVRRLSVRILTQRRKGAKAQKIMQYFARAQTPRSGTHEYTKILN